MQKFDVNSFINEKKKEYPFKEFSDTDTYALRDLKIAIQNRLFWSFIETIGIPKEWKNKLYVYYYLNGRRKFISNQSIFLCREKMQPSRWYYRINEKLPKRINFTPKFDVSRLVCKESAGHQKLKKMLEHYNMQTFADEYNINLYQLKNIIYKRKHPDTMEEWFKTLPPQDFIIKLRNDINPDYWYIFPEELE